MRRQSNMIFICCSKKTDFSRSGRKIKFLKWEKVRKTWCSGGALCGLWPGEHWRANQWHWWLDPMAERPQTYSQWWICQFRCCPAPTENVLRIFLKVKLNIWSPSISSASFGRLLLRDCRSEMIHLKTGRLNIVSNVWRWNPSEDWLHFLCARSDENNSTYLWGSFGNIFWKTTSLWNDGSEVGLSKRSQWGSAHQFAAAKLQGNARKKWKTLKWNQVDWAIF